jgi:hypothetical protein
MGKLKSPDIATRRTIRRAAIDLVHYLCRTGAAAAEARARARAEASGKATARAEDKARAYDVI